MILSKRLKHLPSTVNAIVESTVDSTVKRYDLPVNLQKDKFNDKFCEFINDVKNKIVQKKPSIKSVANTANTVNTVNTVNTFNICILDGMTMRSSKALIKNGIDKENIISIEKDKETRKIHSEFGINVAGKCLNDFIIYNRSDKSGSKYGAYYFDLCNQIHTVSDEILNVLQNATNLYNGVVVGVTFCKRSVIKGAIFDTEYKKFEDKLINVMLNKKYQLKNFHKESYSGNGESAKGARMFTAFYKFYYH